MDDTRRSARRKNPGARRHHVTMHRVARAARAVAWVASRVASITLLAAAAACASMQAPTGGTLSKVPPKLVVVTPDTNARNSKAGEVVFRFDKVILEGTRGTLEKLVVISPSEGDPIVEWRREAIAVRPKKGFRPNTAYTVTLLPGVTDLQNNRSLKPFQTVFATGATIPRGAIRGVAFDWIGQKAIASARIEATLPADTAFRWQAASDSLGRFLLPNLPTGQLVIRVYVDQNSNRQLDRRELFDSITLTVADSARRDFYMFAHDTLGPRLDLVTVVDSETVRVKFDPPVLPESVIDTSSFIVTRMKDTTRLAIRRVTLGSTFDSSAIIRKNFVADSAARADTTVAGRRRRATDDSLRAANVRDSVSRAQVTAIRAARDTVRKEVAPKPDRPAPPTEWVIELLKPLESASITRIQSVGVKGLTGAVRAKGTQRDFSWRRPEKKDSSAAKPVVPVQKPQ
jgi:hypothetical protein